MSISGSAACVQSPAGVKVINIFSFSPVTIGAQCAAMQVEVEKIHKERTAFTVGPLGFYEHCEMPFGLTNSQATYQRLMKERLDDYNKKLRPFAWTYYHFHQSAGEQILC